MNKIVLFYGSSTGTCENLARDIAEKLNLDSSVVHPVSELNEKTVAAADTLLLGTSTWGWGDIQDDWADALPKLKAMSLSGKKSLFLAAEIPPPMETPSVTEWEFSMMN